MTSWVSFDLGVEVVTTRLLPSMAIGFLMYEVLLKALGENHVGWLAISAVLGLSAAAYFHLRWKSGQLSATSLVLWSAALPFCFGIVGLYLHANQL